MDDKEMDNEVYDMCLNSKNYVVMNNDLIKSKSDLSLNEIKLLRITIMQFVKDDDDLRAYKINIADLARMLGIETSNIYRDIYKMCDHLMDVKVYVGDGDPRHDWTIFHWCQSCRYKDGVVTIRLHEDLKQYILNLSELYTQYVLQDILKLRSVYSIRVYELIRQEMRRQKAFCGQEAEITLSVGMIRKVTNTEDKYKDKFSMFKQRVLQKALTEINEKLGYHIDYAPVKNGKRVDAIKLHIVSKADLTLDDG